MRDVAGHTAMMEGDATGGAAFCAQLAMRLDGNVDVGFSDNSDFHDLQKLHKNKKVCRRFGFLVLFLLFRGFKSMCYDTKQETEASQLSVSCDHLQTVEGPIPITAQLLQGTQDHAHQVDQEEHRALHHGLRI